MALDADGSLYITDLSNNRIQKLTSDGIVTTVAGGNGEGSANDQLDSPEGLAIDDNGLLYIGDTSNHRVQRLGSNYLEATTLEELTLATNFEPTDADLLRLYITFFNRQPDLGGAKYWLGIRRDGYNLLEISGFMSDSNEFSNNYSGTTDEQYVARSQPLPKGQLAN